MAYAWSPGPIEPADPSFWEPVNPETMPAATPKASTPKMSRRRSKDTLHSEDSIELSADMYDDSPRKRTDRESVGSQSVDMSMSLKPVTFDTPPRVWVKPLRPASMFEHEKIPGLDKDNFYDTVLKKEKALILFGDSRVPRNGRFDVAYIDAAEKTTNEKFQFGFVDCGYNIPFCKQQKICKIPTLKLYSNGFEVAKMEDMSHINSKHMRQMMAMAPVLKLPKKTLEYQRQLNIAKARDAEPATPADTAQGATADASMSDARLPDMRMATIADALVASIPASRMFETPVKKKRKGLFSCRCLGKN
ncbi:hypothetical protein BsWGS_16982 [Bradybaena similaris]